MLRKLTILTTVLLLAFFVGNASARTFVVDADGDPEVEFLDLQTALNTAATWPGDGHIIEIMPGEYSDHSLTCPPAGKVVEIVAVEEGRNGVVFTDPGPQVNDFMDISGTDGLTISGFTVMSYVYAFTGTDVLNLIMTNMVLDDNGEDGFNCTTGVGDDGGGIRLYNCDDGWFENIEIMNGERGIRLDDNALDGSDGNTILGCFMYELEQYGIGIYTGGNNNTIDGCTIYDIPDRGIQFWGANSGNEVTNCTIYNCNNAGILMSGSTSGTISNNEVFNCSNSITSESSHSPTNCEIPVFGAIYIDGKCHITDNVIYDNGDKAGVGDYGIYVNGGPWSAITGNCIYGHANSAQAFDNSGTKGWNNNYYGAYVSVPHYIDGGDRQDNNPKLFDNSAYADPTTWEIYPDLNDEYVVEFKWAIPDCDPWEETFLAYYNFQVNFDDAMLEYVDGSAEYDETAFGPMDGSTGALYAPIGYGAGTITFAAGNDAAPFAGDFVMARATFRGIDVGPTSITISSTYLDDNEVALTVGNTSLDLEIEDTQPPEIVSVTGPTGWVVTDDDADYYFDTYMPRVKLMVEAQASDNFDLRRIRYEIDDLGENTLIGGLSGTDDGTTAAVLIPTEGIDEGSHILYVWAEDKPYNPSFPRYEQPFEIDRTGPGLDAFVLSDKDECAPNPEYTNEATVTASLTNSDMTAVKRQMHDGSGWGAPIDYTPSGGVDDFDLVGPTSGTTCYARLYDAVGNSIYREEDDIIFDDVAPTPSDFFIEGNADKTNDPVLECDANFNVSGGAVEYNVSDDADDLVCPLTKGASGWLPAPDHDFEYDFTGADDGTLELWFAVRDDAGNISDILYDDIILDTDPPEMTGLTLDDCINDYYDPEVTITWTDTDVEKAYFTINGNSNAAYEFTITDPSALEETFTFPYFLIAHILEDDINVISGYLEDDIGNAGDPIADVEFFFDDSDPTITGVVMHDPIYGQTDPPTAENHSSTLDVEVTCSGLADDITEIHFSETNVWTGEEKVYEVDTDFTISGGECTFIHTYGAAGATSPIVECDQMYLYARVFDCSGRWGGTPSDWIKFDFSDPTLTDVTITTPDPTKNLGIGLAITADDNCVPGGWNMNIYESGGEETAETGWIPATATHTYTLDAGDGTREIIVEVADASGHTASFPPVSVVVDQLPPQGVGAYLEQIGNPHVTPGYTNDKSIGSNQAVITAFDDAVKVRFRELAKPITDSWQTPVPGSYVLPWELSPGNVTKYIDFQMEDAATNKTGWIPMEIILDNIAPDPPGCLTVTGTPGGSCMLEIDPAVTGANKYYARFNYSTQYPTYDDWVDIPAKPPFPDLLSGNGEFFFDEGETTCDFEGPQMDIYSFSIWTYDMGGNISTTYNTDVTSTNYILSDLENDGVVNFGADLGLLGTSYDQSPGDPGDFYNAECDYGPTVDDLPKPNDYVGFDELVIAVSNYAVFGDWIARGGIEDGPEPLKLTPELIVSTEMPSRLSTGDVCTISLNCNNPGPIAAFHMILGFDKDKIQITNIESGEMFNTEEKKFFYDKVKDGELWLDGAIFGGEAQFADNEIAQISFEAKADIEQFNLEDVVIDIRNIEGDELSVTFQIKKTIENVIPSEFALRQNYPNPFNPSTTIEMALPVASNWTIAIYNIVGQKVSEFNGYNEAGIHNVIWDATGQASGIYFYKINTGDFKATKKMVLLK